MEKSITKREKTEAFLGKTGLKIYQLADLAKVPRTTLYRWVKGWNDIKLSQWEKLEKVITRLK